MSPTRERYAPLHEKEPAPVATPPSGVGHLRWLYLLGVVPTLTDIVEKGGLPTTARELFSEIVVTTLLLGFVTVVIRQSQRLATQLDAYLKTKEQLRHADRLATVGRLAAGVAHELGSPLQVVAGRAKMIATGDVVGEEAEEYGQIVLDQSHRMTQIIRGLLDFSRRRPPQRATTDLQNVAREVHRMLGSLAKKKALELELHASEASVFVDPIQVQQALTNLVMNAIQAVREGGRISIQVELATKAPPLEPDAVACGVIRVVDDGPGIPEENLARVFEPFFTTKEIGEGTGLGLSVVHGLVRENGGWVAVESVPGTPTSFTMCFPCERAS